MWIIKTYLNRRIHTTTALYVASRAAAVDKCSEHSRVYDNRTWTVVGHNAQCGGGVWGGGGGG